MPLITGHVVALEDAGTVRERSEGSRPFERYPEHAKPAAGSWIIRAMVELERFNGRRAAVLENAALRVAVLEGGGHIASILDNASGVSPLWIPPWPSIEPSAYEPGVHGSYGSSVEARLLASIMGHNLCRDVFGGPSEEEVAAGQSVHGEASMATYAFEGSKTGLTMRADFPTAQLQFERQLELIDRTIRVREVLENVSASDRPIAWTQHVTLGPPFLERGRDPSEPATTSGPAPSSTGRMPREPAEARSTCFAMWMPHPPALTPRT